MAQIENIKKLFSDFCFYRNDGGEKEFNEWLDENFSEQPVENKEQVVYVPASIEEFPCKDDWYILVVHGGIPILRWYDKDGGWDILEAHYAYKHWLKSVPLSSLVGGMQEEGFMSKQAKEIEQKIILWCKEKHYSSGNSYDVRITAKGKWAVKYSNDYPMQHGDGKEFILTEDDFLEAMKIQTNNAKN